MTRFETSEINLAAYLATTFSLNILYAPDEGKALFDFADTPQLRDAIISYERGAQRPAKALLLTRTRLYHEASKVAARGRSCTS